MKYTARQRQNAITRILSGDSTAETEAQHLGVDARTIYRWVADVRKASGSPKDVSKTADAVVSQQTSETVTPPGETPSDTPNPALKAALDAAGEGSGQVNAPTGAPASPDQARTDMEATCLEAYGGFRAAVGSTLVQWQYSPPLDATSPEVMRLLKVGPAATLAIKANAPRLFPLLVKWSSGWAPLLMAIGADSVGMLIGLAALAKSKGWTAPPKKEKGADAPAPAKKPFDMAAARARQQEIDDKMAEAGKMDVGSNSQQLNAPRPDAA